MMDVLQVCVMEEPKLERGERRESLLDDVLQVCVMEEPELERGERRKSLLDDVLQVCVMEEPELERGGRGASKRANTLQDDDDDGLCVNNMQRDSAGRKELEREFCGWSQ
jgi:hypothetical protein